jgi:hypothetical protein
MAESSVPDRPTTTMMVVPTSNQLRDGTSRQDGTRRMRTDQLWAKVLHLYKKIT